MPEDRTNTATCDLPKPRGRMNMWISLGALAIFYTGGVLIVAFCKPFKDARNYAILGPIFSVFIMSAFYNIIRICQLSEELRHIPTRYKSYMDVLKAVFVCNTLTCMSYTVSAAVTLPFWYVYKNPVEYLHSFGGSSMLMMFAVGFIWSHIVKMEASPLKSSLLIENFELNFGSGMALSFFYGYLRIVLPDTGETNKGIKKKIRTYVNQNHLDENSFPVKKLFILIPKNLTMPPTLTDISDDMMEIAKCLEEEKLDRSGVRCRIYKNSVYKIKTEPKPTYVVVEGASPLKTYEEIIKYHRHLRETYNQFRDDIVLSFYTTLQCIIDEEDCGDVCELIYYNDRDEAGRKVNIANVLLERIKQIIERDNMKNKNLRNSL